MIPDAVLPKARIPRCLCGARLTQGLEDGWAQSSICRICGEGVCDKCAASWDVDEGEDKARVRAECEGCAVDVIGEPRDKEYGR